MRAPGEARLWIMLLAVGIAWGTTQSLSRIAVTGGLDPIGLAFWQTLLAAALLGAWIAVRGGRLPLSRAHLRFYAVSGFLGTAFPHILAFTAAEHLPAGILSILIACVPMMTLVLALGLRQERASLARLTGLGLGLAAVLLIALPKASLPEGTALIWVALPILVALSYAGENIWIAVAQPRDLDAIGALCGLSIAALALIAPLLLVEGSWVEPWRFGRPEQAMLLMAALHIFAYAGLIWLITTGGAVFGAQVGYVVMGSGVVIGMIALGERHPLWVWAALALMAAGVALVKPRRT